MLRNVLLVGAGLFVFAGCGSDGPSSGVASALAVNAACAPLAQTVSSHAPEVTRKEIAAMRAATVIAAEELATVDGAEAIGAALRRAGKAATSLRDAGIAYERAEMLADELNGTCKPPMTEAFGKRVAARINRPDNSRATPKTPDAAPTDAEKDPVRRDAESDPTFVEVNRVMSPYLSQLIDDPSLADSSGTSAEFRSLGDRYGSPECREAAEATADEIADESGTPDERRGRILEAAANLAMC